MKILFVCLGNICRSPLAEGIMREKIKQRGIEWEVDSAGTGHWHAGEAPDPRSVDIAEKYGIDISRQRARQFRPADLDRFDQIYVMDASNYRDVMKHTTDEDRDKVRLMMSHVYPNREVDVPDPYWDDDGFNQVYHMLNEACDHILKHHEEE